MIQLVETSDYLKAITPFYNGHAFTAYIEEEDVSIGIGCYCLEHLGGTFHRLLIRSIENNNYKPISIKTFNNVDSYNEIRIAIIEFTGTECNHCSGSVLFKKLSN